MEGLGRAFPRGETKSTSLDFVSGCLVSYPKIGYQVSQIQSHILIQAFSSVAEKQVHVTGPPKTDFENEKYIVTLYLNE